MVKRKIDVDKIIRMSNKYLNELSFEKYEGYVNNKQEFVKKDVFYIEYNFEKYPETMTLREIKQEIMNLEEKLKNNLSFNKKIPIEREKYIYTILQEEVKNYMKHLEPEFKKYYFVLEREMDMFLENTLRTRASYCFSTKVLKKELNTRLRKALENSRIAELGNVTVNKAQYASAKDKLLKKRHRAFRPYVHVITYNEYLLQNGLEEKVVASELSKKENENLTIKELKNKVKKHNEQLKKDWKSSIQKALSENNKEIRYRKKLFEEMVEIILQEIPSFKESEIYKAVNLINPELMNQVLNLEDKQFKTTNQDVSLGRKLARVLTKMEGFKK